MSLKKKIQILSVILLIISAVLLLPFVEWSKTASLFGYISLLFGAAGSIVSIFIPNSFTYHFTAQSWQPFHDGEIMLEIKEGQHGMGKSPKCEVMQKNANGYEVVLCSIKHSEKGSVSIHAYYPFDGKVTIH
jgi:hypothetical protein